MEIRVFDNYKLWLGEQKLPNGQKKALLAALDLFAKQGYDGTSTAQIAEFAGVSQATIFKYFKTKQDLLDAIIEPVLENFFPIYRDDFLEELRRFKSLKELIHGIIQNRYRFMQDNEDAVMILLTEMMISSKVRQMFFKVVNDPDNSLVTGMENLLRATGEVRDELDGSALLRTMIGQMLTYFMQHRFLGNPNEEQDLKLIEEQIVLAIQN